MEQTITVNNRDSNTRHKCTPKYHSDTNCSFEGKKLNRTEGVVPHDKQRKLMQGKANNSVKNSGSSIPDEYKQKRMMVMITVKV